MSELLTRSNKIYSTDELRSGVFYLYSTGAAKFLRTYDSNNSALHAQSNSADQYCMFQFLPAPNGAVRLFSLYHRAFISAIGEGWPLFPRVEDDSWSHFNLIENADGTICLKCSHPLSDNSFVSVIGEERIVRVAEKSPRQPWSYFTPFSATAHIDSLNAFVAERVASIKD